MPKRREPALAIKEAQTPLRQLKSKPLPQEQMAK
jgi:hypothetical protein